MANPDHRGTPAEGARGSGLPADWRWLAFLCALSALYSARLLWVTRANGVGLSVDSLSYLGAADSLFSRGALKVPVASWRAPSPEGDATYFPPLLPIALSALRPVFDARSAARVLNAVMGFSSLFLSLFAVGRAAGWAITVRSALAMVAVALVFLGRGAGIVHLWAWSEPLFLFLVLAFASAVERGLGRLRPAVWCLAGGLAGLASLTRYAGVCLVSLGLLLLLGTVRNTRDLAPRLRSGALFFAAFALVYAPWILHLRGLGIDTGPRQFGYFPAFLEHFLLDQAYSTGRWVLASSASADAMRLCGVACLVLILVFLVGRARQAFSVREERGPLGSSTAALTAFAALFYLAFLAAIATSVTPGIGGDLDGRLLSPFFLLATIAFASSFASRPGEVPLSAGVLGFLFLGLSAWNARPAMAQAATFGLGVERQPMRDSPLLAWLRADGASYPAIFTNAPHAVYFGAGRPAFLTPSRGEEAALGEFGIRVRTAGGLYVWFRDESWGEPIDPARVASDADLSRLVAFADGEIFRAREAPPVPREPK